MKKTSSKKQKNTDLSSQKTKILFIYLFQVFRLIPLYYDSFNILYIYIFLKKITIKLLID